MARQAIASGSVTPVFVNETTTLQAISTAPVYVDQTIAAPGPPSAPQPATGYAETDW